MASDIDVNIPPLGTPTTAGVRANFAAAKAEIETLQESNGFADYNDSATVGSPIAVSPSVWTKLTNNKLGPFTKIDALPVGITNLWNASTNQLVLTEVPLNSMISIRADLVVTTTATNQTVTLRTQLGIGSVSEFPLDMTEVHFKTTGAKNVIGNFHFYVGSNDIKINPGELRVWSDGACTVVVNGWYIRVSKR